MAAATFLIDGAVLRDLLGLPAGTEVDSVVLEVSHPKIKPGHSIAPTFRTVAGRQRLHSWGQTPLPKGRPLSKAERVFLQQQIDTLSKHLTLARNIDRDYSDAFSDPSGGTAWVKAKLPARYLR